MAKRLKLRISRVFPSFQSCRSKDLPQNPLPPVFRLSTFNPKPLDLDFPPPPPPTPPPSSLRRHVSSAIVSVGCGCRNKTHRPISSTPPPPSDFQWKKEEKWHVVARISNHRRHISSDDSYDDIFPDKTTTRKKKKKINKQKSKIRNTKKNKMNRTRARISISSADHSVWFSSDDAEDDNEDDDQYNDDDTETLVSSSRTFSDDSTPGFFSTSLETIKERKPRKGRRVKTGRGKRREEEVLCPTPETETPARMSVFRRMMTWGMEGKVRESVAVVKRSEDPYGDFKRSMVEMILEKEMYGADDLEELLQCFLSLNSRAHHGVIVEAFSEIWEALFFSNRSETPKPGKGGGGGGGSGVSRGSAISLF